MKRTVLPILPTTFVAVVEQGSITRAAEELGLAKSAVSQNLKRLEEQVGVKLAVRTTRLLTLTPAGERYFKRCKEIVALSKKADAEMALFGAVPTGSLKITAPHAMISTVVAPALGELIKRYPSLKPELVADDSRLDIVAESIDVALTLGNLKDSSLKARRVGEMEDILCVSKQLMGDTKKLTSTDAWLETQELPYIAHHREPASGVHFRLAGEGKNSHLDVQFKRMYTANTTHALLAFCREGLGVAMLPSFTISNDLKTGKLIRLFPDYSLGRTPIYAVHPYDRYVPESVRAFVEAIKIALSE